MSHSNNPLGAVPRFSLSIKIKIFLGRYAAQLNYTGIGYRAKSNALPLVGYLSRSIVFSFQFTFHGCKLFGAFFAFSHFAPIIYRFGLYNCSSPATQSPV
jgi:hypothetical protein